MIISCSNKNQMIRYLRTDMAVSCRRSLPYKDHRKDISSP